MPQSVQIVPKHTHPYVEVVVNDNTEYELGATVTDNSAPDYTYISVFPSGKGVDNKLVSTEGLKSLYSRYGYTNYKLYGQGMLNAEALLSQGNTKVWTMRVTPDDATYANSVLSLWYKVDEAKKKFRIKATVKSLSKFNEAGKVVTEMEEILSDRDAIIEKAKELDGAAVDGAYVDSEGYTQVPIAVFTSAGRGVYGNNFKWRISRDEDYEKEYGFKLYRFECYDTDNGMAMNGLYTGSLVSSSKTRDLAFLNDVLEEAGIEKTPTHIHIFEENIENLYEVYVEFLNKLMKADPSLDIEIPDMDCFDPIFGKQLANGRVKVTPDDEYIQIIKLKTDEIDENEEDGEGHKVYDMDDYTSIFSDDPTKENSILVSDVTGIGLYGGHDGSFTVDKTNDPDGKKRQAAIDAELIKAFSGAKDKTILSARRMPSATLFDANYSLPVKKALVKLTLFRNDAICYLDTNLLDTITSADIKKLDSDFAFIDEFEEDFDPFNPYLVSVNLHYYNITEYSTGKRIPVTITYFLAQTHASHWANYGYHIPMVGSKYTTLSGQKKNSLRPIIDEYEDDLMDELNTHRFNYFECVNENVFYRGTQNTFQAANTDLLEENNVNTLLWLKRNITDDARSEIYNFTDASSRADFVTYIKAKYKHLIGNQLYSLDISYSVNEWEFNRNIVHLYLAIKFRKLAKRVIVEIDVNKRTIDEE